MSGAFTERITVGEVIHTRAYTRTCLEPRTRLWWMNVFPHFWLIYCAWSLGGIYKHCRAVSVTYVVSSCIIRKPGTFHALVPRCKFRPRISSQRCAFFKKIVHSLSIYFTEISFYFLFYLAFQTSKNALKINMQFEWNP